MCADLRVREGYADARVVREAEGMGSLIKEHHTADPSPHRASQRFAAG
jgi:hypothetical protein